MRLTRLMAAKRAAMVALGALFGLCGCVTMRTSHDFGVHHQSLEQVTRIEDRPSGIVIEFQGQGIHYLSEMKKTDLFSAPSHDFLNLHLQEGRIPASTKSSQSAQCLQFENGPRNLIPQATLSDTCSRKTTTLFLGQTSYRDWWHTALLPIVYPLTIATDIVLSPMYAYGLVWCKYHTCTPM